MAAKTISPISAQSSPDRAARPASPKPGFTLIELLVVIGIIAVLAGLTIHAVMRARIGGVRTAQKMELQAIVTGLEAYRQDQGEYPPVIYQDSGAEVLGMALVGPGPRGPDGTSSPTPADKATIAFDSAKTYPVGSMVNLNYVNPDPINGVAENNGISFFALKQTTAVTPTTTGSTDWQQMVLAHFWDNADGAGFRVRRQGKVIGPYLDPSKFRMRGLQILDRWDNPILYFPANGSRPNVSSINTATYISTNLATYAYVGQMATQNDTNNNNAYNGAQKKQGSFASLFDAGDNISAFIRPGETRYQLPPVTSPAVTPAFRRIAMLLGDYTPHTPGDTSATPHTTDFNGVIDTGETAVTKPYVLWSAGPDGQFGVTNLSPWPTAGDLQKTDDVLNLED